jgi:ubiquinone/menaquinone biosynthesis C-methylase UbiE
VNVSDDVAEHKDWLLSLVPAPNSGIWVDLGCGDGSDVRRLALRQPAAGLRIVGIDSNRKVIEEAQRNTGDDPRVEFQSYSLGRTLPFDDATVDVAYSNNLIECLADVSSFISEITRILRPGGFVVMAHWDWDSQMFDGSDKNRNRPHACAHKLGFFAATLWLCESPGHEGVGQKRPCDFTRRGRVPR